MTGTTDSAPNRRPLHVFYKLTFANKILVITLVLLVVLGIAGTAVSQLVLRRQLGQEVAASTRMLAVTAGRQAAPLLARQDLEALSALVKDLQRTDSSIAYVLIRDRDGVALAHTFGWDPPDAVSSPAGKPSPTGKAYHRRLAFDGSSYLEVTAPILVGAIGAGTLQVGTGMERVNRFARELNLVFLVVLAGLTALGVLASRTFVRYVTRPVSELTHLADQVSVGNLDVDFDFGVHVNCWEIKSCGRTDCGAYGNTAVQCWFVDGTPCEGYEPRFPQKLMGCRTCEVYRAHKGDEIVQLADSFRHMTHVLKTSRQELERSHQFQRTLIQNSLVGIIATDKQDVVRIFNGVAQRLTGYAEEESVGEMKWDLLFPRELRAERRRPALRDGAKPIFGFYRKETAIRRKDGASVAVLASGMTLRDGDEHVGKVFFFRDLREVKKLREELIRSERLAAIGETVASISHSIKNILEGLRGGAYIYNRGTSSEDPELCEEGWSMVERNIDLISALVADLLNYARDREPDLQPCDPNELVADIVELLGAKAGRWGVSLETTLDPAVSPFSLDTHGIHQCITNLVTNAIDAAGDVDGGRVLISTSLRGEDTLELRIEDNGPGVPPELAEQLFSSMISTKGSKGSGLGLLVVHKIVTEHGGSVSVESTPGAGAAFTVRLPRHRLPGQMEESA